MDRILNVAAIAGGVNTPGRRFRIAALKPYLMENNISVKEICPKISTYPPNNRLLRFPWIVAAFLERLTFLHRAKGFEAVILQRELISTLPTLENLLPKPMILDVDDAIYLNRKGKAAVHAARSSSLIVCGNHYLAEKFSQWNSNVTVIPTGVDTRQLYPRTEKIAQDKRVLGWIGTSANYEYLKNIKPALEKTLKQNPLAKLQIISDKSPKFLKEFGLQLDFRKWYSGIENELLPRFDVGIMPLTDSEWARGKCAFKMLQYMAAGVPVVASPVGVNADLFASGSIGLAAVNNDEWAESMSSLLDSSVEARNMGLNGRKLVEQDYSLSIVSEKWKLALTNLLS